MQPSIDHPTRVLLVDDDESIRIMLGELLVREGFTVFLAADGMEAASLVEELGLDLVLTDHNMPRMDGWELALFIRRRLPRLPILLVSGDPDGLSRARDPRNPFDGVLAKPFQMKALLSMIHALPPGGPQPEMTPHGPELPRAHQPWPE